MKNKDFFVASIMDASFSCSPPLSLSLSCLFLFCEKQTNKKSRMYPVKYGSLSSVERARSLGVLYHQSAFKKKSGLIPEGSFSAIVAQTFVSVFE